MLYANYCYFNDTISNDTTAPGYLGYLALRAIARLNLYHFQLFNVPKRPPTVQSTRTKQKPTIP